MHDLAEHTGTILWIVAGLLSIVGALIGLTWRDLRGSLGEIKKEAGKFPAWLLEREKDGGVVTRDKHFAWCAEYQGKCPAFSGVDIISKWRSTMLEKGGVLTRAEHGDICEHITEKVMERMDECFAHQKEWFGTQLTVIQGTMENKVLKELQGLRQELGKTR